MLARGSRRRLLALRLCRGLIQSSRARGAVVIASPNRSCPAQPGRERNHRHYRPPPIAPPAPRDFDRCCRMRVLGQRRRAQRWRGLLRLPCRGRLRRRLAGVEEFRARSFGQIRIDERQLRTERLDRESVPGAKRQMTRSATPAAFGTRRDPGQARGRESHAKNGPGRSRTSARGFEVRRSSAELRGLAAQCARLVGAILSPRAVAVAQLVEPRVVVPVVGGSSPLRHLLSSARPRRRRGGAAG